MIDYHGQSPKKILHLCGARACRADDRESVAHSVDLLRLGGSKGRMDGSLTRCSCG